MVEAKKTKKYFEAVGRRKESIARVRVFTNKKGITVNGKKIDEYFPTSFLKEKAKAPMTSLKCEEKFGVEILVKGGGISSQAQACSHGIARVLVLINPYFRKRLKKEGFLTRDPRARERKKFGLKRARKAPQWSKR